MGLTAMLWFLYFTRFKRSRTRVNTKKLLGVDLFAHGRHYSGETEGDNALLIVFYALKVVRWLGFVD